MEILVGAGFSAVWMTFLTTFQTQWSAFGTDARRMAMAAALAGGLPAYGAVVSPNLADLSIEQLMNESVTSVSKKQTSLSQSPAAVSVVTNEDIRRLGITSLPEALRLVPGLDVARINASEWAISSRGFNVQYANKLLVLVDGRSVYTPSFGGVNWDSQDLILEDLDRIEVIRGPGATLWGANAVNGVINITSKSARETQGGLVTTAFGSEEQPSVGIRYGGAVGADLHYRVSLKAFNRDGFSDTDGHETPDDWDSLRGGFRVDWEPNGDDLVTFQGGMYSMQTGENVTTPIFTPPFARTAPVDNSSHGGNLIARWTRQRANGSQFMLQGYFDTFRHGSGITVESRDTADISFEYRFKPSPRNEVVWGFGYRYTQDHFTDTEVIQWSPSADSLNLFSGFVQDEIVLIPEKLRFILGSKIEHNDFTGWEIQPSARLLWTPTDTQTVWMSASHAAGTPSRNYRDSRVNLTVVQPPGLPPVEAAWIGKSNVVSETVNAYEIGYRIQPAPNFSVDFTAFYNDYQHLFGVQKQALELEGTHLLLPYDFANSEYGTTYGTELSVDWKPLDFWRLTGNYSWLQMDLHPVGALAAGSPQQQFSLRSYLDLPGNCQFNVFASYVDSIESLDKTATNIPVPSYFRLDAGIIWRPNPNLEIGLWGTNLLDSGHPEFSSQNTTRMTEIPRGVLGKITWRF